MNTELRMIIPWQVFHDIFQAAGRYKSLRTNTHNAEFPHVAPPSSSYLRCSSFHLIFASHLPTLPHCAIIAPVSAETCALSNTS